MIKRQKPKRSSIGKMRLFTFDAHGIVTIETAIIMVMLLLMAMTALEPEGFLYKLFQLGETSNNNCDKKCLKKFEKEWERRWEQELARRLRWEREWERKLEKHKH